MSLSDWVFWGFGLLVVSAGGLVAFSGNILRSGFALLLCFFGVAGLYVLLGADLLAGIQVLLYVGGIVVLILFAILVTHKIRSAHLSNESRNRPQALLLSGGAFGLLAGLSQVFPPGSPAASCATAGPVGEALLTTYLLPFEAVSVLLLAALVGAALIVRKEVRPAADEAETPRPGLEQVHA